MNKISAKYQRLIEVTFFEYMINEKRDKKILNALIDDKSFQIYDDMLDTVNYFIDSFLEIKGIKKYEEINVEDFIKYFLSKIVKLVRDKTYVLEEFEQNGNNDREFFSSFVIPLQLILTHNFLTIANNGISKLSDITNINVKSFFIRNSIEIAWFINIEQVFEKIDTFIDNPTAKNDEFIQMSNDEKKKILLSTIDLVLQRFKNTKGPITIFKDLLGEFPSSVFNEVEAEIIKTRDKIDNIFKNDAKASKFSSSALYDIIKFSEITTITYKDKEYRVLSNLNNGLTRGYHYMLYLLSLEEYDGTRRKDLKKKLQDDLKVFEQYPNLLDFNINILINIIDFYKFKKYASLLPAIYISNYSNTDAKDMAGLTRNFFKSTSRPETLEKEIKKISTFINDNYMY